MTKPVTYCDGCMSCKPEEWQVCGSQRCPPLTTVATTKEYNILTKKRKQERKSLAKAIRDGVKAWSKDKEAVKAWREKFGREK